MRLAAKLALSMTALVVAVVGTAIWSIGAYLRRDVERQLSAQIDESGKELQRAQRDTLRLLAALNRGYADEPRTKAVINSAEVDDGTVADVARDIRETAGFDVMLIANPDGTLRANETTARKPVAVPQGYVRPAEELGTRREFTSAWQIGSELYLMAGNAVMLADRTAGVILAGWGFTNQRANDLHLRLKSDLVLVVNDRMAAWALDEHLESRRGELLEVMRATHAALPTAAKLVSIGGREYMLQKTDVDQLLAPAGASRAYFVTLRSLDEALKPYYRLRSFLFKLSLLAVAVALLAALVLANTLSRRVTKLAAATTLVASGDLDTSMPIGGRDEIGALGRAFNDMISKLRISREELRSKERLERELEIATVIQTLLLPAQPALDGFDVAARMVPAEEVGGDFYDLHTATGGSWIAIGDVSGHGVTPGLIMMMVQSMLSAMARQSPEIGEQYAVKEVLRVINAALHDNLKTRMHDDNYMTMVLLKHIGGGKFRFAGAHEALLVYRRAKNQVETLTTEGSWLGLQEDIGPFVEEKEVELLPGDALILYTDGVTEAKNPQGVQYNLDRLRDMAQKHGGASMPSAQKIRDGIIDDVMTWSRTRQDDVTVMVLRRLEP